ncbi:hypothetical protein [Massilia endophytica]|uniref:hypothetical protein n=1 Tax=Massilia endophytica TaxID=2899220 RepID=UPI001E465CDF|nr:hypothetical protein [Massilia endophytica]UGQ48836.1 hypothetical protein LSQ66_10355 [Massilia endophytica]
MVKHAAIATLAAAALAGCAVPYSPVPVATNFPNSGQEKLQAAAHWDIIANDLEHKLAEKLRKQPPRPVYLADPAATATPFQRALHTSLVSALVNDGFSVSRSPAGSLKVEMDVQAVTFAENRTQFRYTGGPLALATGIWVLSDIDPVTGVLGAVGAHDLYRYHTSIFSPGATPKTEIIVTVSVGDQFRYFARTTSAYYVADEDRALYGIKDEPKDAQMTKVFKVRGDR